MAYRTQTYILTKGQWSGGVNTSADPGALPSADLQVAENIIFDIIGSRLKREGLDLLDEPSIVPTAVSRSSSSSTRTIVFSSAVSASSPNNHKIALNESIIVSGGPASYNGTFYVDSVSGSTITYTGGSSVTESSTPDTAITVQRAGKYLDVRDYWRFVAADNNKQQLIMAISDQGFLIQHDSNGRRSNIVHSGLSGSLPFTNALTTACSIIFNEKYIFGGRAGNLLVAPRKYNPDDSSETQLLAGSPPKFTMVVEHLGRLWCDDPEMPDRIRYSATGNPEQWDGTGDSGALDISPGDGDPRGITTIFPPFRGVLFVAKGGRLYKIIGTTPEDFQVVPVTSGIGSESFKAATAVDFDDVAYVSKRGFHSIATSDQFGDFAGNFLTANIQRTFNEWPKDRLEEVSAVYVPELNSICFSVAEEGQAKPSALWWYNTVLKAWFVWPNQTAYSLATYQDGEGNRRLIWGNDRAEVVRYGNGLFLDYNGIDSRESAIRYNIKTGALYPDNNPNSWKGFKKIGFLYKPIGRYSFTAKIYIDNLPVQTLSFSQDVSGDELGVDFILGESVLGTDLKFAPFTLPIGGYGRGITLEVINDNKDEQVELYGFVVEWEPAERAQASAGQA